MESNEKIRMHFIFRGDVQGVGFRYRARYAAGGLGLTGWVKNEWDGSVVMEVQGNRASINRMLVTINSGSYIDIEDMESERIPYVPEEHGFRVVY